VNRDDEVSSFPDITIEVVDHSLSAAALDDFVREYPASTAGHVTVDYRWGGPWASGPGVEIAVVFVATSLLSGFIGAIAADAYTRVRDFIAKVLPTIETEASAERRGFGSPLAIAFESRRLPLRIEFLLPQDGRDEASAKATIDEVFGVAAAELGKWEARLESEFQLGPDDALVQIWLAWNEDSDAWSDFEGEWPGHPDWELLLKAGRRQQGE
jgi:hypothetical protein